MKKEDLLKIMDEEAAEKVLKLSEQDSKGANKTIADLQKELNDTKKDLADANKALDDAKKVDIEKIKADEFERGKKEVQAEFDKYKNDLAIDAAIKEAGAKDISDIKPHIDMEKVTFEDGKISGLSEQLEKIKTDKGYLFNSDEKKPSFGGKSGGGNTVTKDDFAKMSYKQKLDLYNTDRELYDTLAQ